MIIRGPLAHEDYRPLFSGHETFPLRYGWLKKAFDAVAALGEGEDSKAIFLDDSSIARFGVGKNMVSSIRHWATSCGIIAEAPGSDRLVVTPFGHYLFGEKGVDRYLEHPTSLWLLHWKLCSGETLRGMKTTWYWAFNHFSNVTFRREDLASGLMKLAEERQWPRVSRTTVQRDVECFVRTYESRLVGGKGTIEDSVESALAELGLIRGLHGQFQFVRGPKRSLSDAIFFFALNNFWNRTVSSQTLSFEVIAHEAGSPGRIFLLDEASLADKLLAMEDLTNGRLRWSETAGLKQALRDETISESEALKLLRLDYRHQGLEETG